MRFCLIDQITRVQPGEGIEGFKTLSLAEEYLMDHFPGFPVMPGVLMVEALIQLGAWYLKATSEFQYSTVLLKQAKAVKFNNFLVPGKSLMLSLQVHKQEGAECTFKASGTVDGTNAVSARMTLVQFNLADKNPAMKPQDERMITEAKKLFDQLRLHAVPQ